ncbi:MAG: hypothetical protein O7F69_06865 [Alphaproteobacteria bacterium]|nr:hypothetical protein [Alphaproteobacteria bacterium]MCZ6845606.1 hypothetical protein [Alphaproteobacteria bacterium]
MDQLGGDQDADVLEAARDLHAQITAAGLNWDELLMPDVDTTMDSTETDETAVETDETAVSDHSDQDGDDAAPSAGKKGKNAETLALIEKLLAKPDRSDALREELEDYKEDIAQGEFNAKDHQYVRALYARLAK